MCNYGHVYKGNPMPLVMYSPRIRVHLQISMHFENKALYPKF